MQRAHGRLRVVGHRRRALVGRVGDPEPAAEVVGREVPERGDRLRRAAEAVEVEQLRADVHVQAVQLEAGGAGDPVEQRRRLLERDAELGLRAAGVHRRVRLAGHRRVDAQQHALVRGAPSRSRRSTSSGPSITIMPTPAASASPMSSSLLALPCSRMCAGSKPAASAIASSPAEATSQPRPSSARIRVTGAHGSALEAKCTSVSAWRLLNASRYSRAVSRRPCSSTTRAGVPNSAATSASAQPPTVRRPSASGPPCAGARRGVGRSPWRGVSRRAALAWQLEDRRSSGSLGVRATKLDGDRVGEQRLRRLARRRSPASQRELSPSTSAVRRSGASSGSMPAAIEPSSRPSRIALARRARSRCASPRAARLAGRARTSPRRAPRPRRSTCRGRRRRRRTRRAACARPPGGRSLLIGRHLRRRPLVGVVERRLHEAVAVVEVVVEERGRYAGLRRDLLDAQAAHAAAGDDDDGGVEDRAPARGRSRGVRQLVLRLLTEFSIYCTVTDHERHSSKGRSISHSRARRRRRPRGADRGDRDRLHPGGGARLAAGEPGGGLLRRQPRVLGDRLRLAADHVRARLVEHRQREPRRAGDRHARSPRRWRCSARGPAPTTPCRAARTSACAAASSAPR